MLEKAEGLARNWRRAGRALHAHHRAQQGPLHFDEASRAVDWVRQRDAQHDGKWRKDQAAEQSDDREEHLERRTHGAWSCDAVVVELEKQLSVHCASVRLA